MNTQVQSVDGLIDVSSLGRVLIHEHLMSLTPGPWLHAKSDDDRVELAVGALAGTGEQGIGTVVDLSPYGVVGRSDHGGDVTTLRDIASQTGLNIVAGSSIYLESYSPRWARQATLAEMHARFVKDAVDGIGESDVKAGIFGEQATSLSVITDHEEKCLRAVARAQSDTGLAVYTHTTHGTMAMDQVAILRSEGAELDRVVIGHMDICEDSAVVRSVLDTGACIAFDTIGKEYWDFVLEPLPADMQRGEFAKRSYFLPDADRADRLVDLVDRGYAPQIVLGMDLTGAEAYLNPSTHGTFGYSYLTSVFTGLLSDRGVSGQVMEEMVSATPARLLASR